MEKDRIEVLKQALKMEEDGKAYYETARNKTSNEMGKKIFEFLIKAEGVHIQKIKQLYKSLEETGKWPDLILTRDSEEIIQNIFSEALGSLEEKVKGTTDDIEALKVALDLERNGQKYYESRAEETDDPFEKKFYLLLAHEEGEHFISILDTIQFLEDPQAYYHQMEITKGFQ